MRVSDDEFAPEMFEKDTLSDDDCHCTEPVFPDRLSVVLLVPEQTEAGFEIVPATDGPKTTIVFETLLLEIDDEHSLDVRFVMVINAFPAVLSPETVNDAVPAVVTVTFAVRPVALGRLRLYVMTYFPTGNPEAVELSVTTAVPSAVQTDEVAATLLRV